MATLDDAATCAASYLELPMMVLSQQKRPLPRGRRPCHAIVVPACLLLVTALAAPAAAYAQQTGLTLAAARAQARLASPSIAAARAAVEAAAARQRQAGAIPNPVLTFSREQTAPGTQDIAALEQRLELGGQRAARHAAARLRLEAATARLVQAEADLDHEVARQFALAVAARQRADLAATAAEQFRHARTQTEHRLAGGDVSGYEARRIRLEVARYAALSAEASLVARDAAIRLQTLLGSDTSGPLEPLTAMGPATLMLEPDSAASAAIARSAEVRAAALDADAADADAHLVRAERLPSPAVIAGYKREQADATKAYDGFVAGFALALPLWDRRGGAMQASDADARRVAAELTAVRRRVGAEARRAAEAVRRADEQAAILAGALGAEARAALRAVEAAYQEGEITLVEWLDAVRAYQEAESAHAAVLAESFIQRAALERLLGVALIR